MAVTIWVLAAATPAQAYLDPSTGSMLLSAGIGLLATLGLGLKTYWYRIRAFLRRAEQQPGNESARAGEPTGRGGRDRR